MRGNLIAETMRAGHTDIHFHLLPGVDDGPATLEEAVELARAAVRDGTDTVVATPHVRPDHVVDVWDLRDRFRELKETLASARVPLSVRAGGELGHEMVGRMHQDELDSIAQGPPHRRWVLLEAPFTGIAADFNRAADELRDRGFGIVIAHPERSAGVLATNRAGLDHELMAGSVLQVNASSLAGDHGSAARAAGLSLVKLGLVIVIASDAHGGARKPGLTLAHRILDDAAVGSGVARSLIDSGPRRLMTRGLEPIPAALG